MTGRVILGGILIHFASLRRTVSEYSYVSHHISIQSGTDLEAAQRYY